MPMTLSRRDFLAVSAAMLAAPCVGRSQEEAAEPYRLILSAPLTHSDWMLHAGSEWGAPGVRKMLDACKACGWSRIYWRTLGGGRAEFPSKLVEPMHKWGDDHFWSPATPEDEAVFRKYYPNVSEEYRRSIIAKLEQYDYGSFDPLAEAVSYGHKIGLQIHAWITINEDDHGWGFQSRFAREHPQFRWVRRDGRPYRSQMSFAFPQVRQYKLDLVQEILDGYEVDGIFIDWIRTGDVRDNPQTDADGVADSGYEQPLVEEFKTRHGIDPHEVANGDPRWVAVRAEPQTQFMRELRQRMHKADKPLAVMVGHPWHYRGLLDKIDGNLRGLLLDVQSWAEQDLFDQIVAAGYYRDGGNPERAYHALRDETANRKEVWTFAWVPHNVEGFEQDVALARRVGARQMLLWEADYIAIRANAPELQQAMRRRARL